MKGGGGAGVQASWQQCVPINFTEFIALQPLEKKHHSRVDYGGQRHWKKKFSINQKLRVCEAPSQAELKAAKAGFQVLIFLLF